MKYLITFLLTLMAFAGHSTVLYPGFESDVQHNALTGEHGPLWSVDNPAISLNSVGFLCHVTAKEYFSGKATVTCTYKDRVGTSDYTRTQKWSFTCGDTKISISPSSKSIKVGESFKMTWNFDDFTYISPSMQFTGYDTDIVDVTSYGMVTAKAEGYTKIYVKSNIGTNSAICHVRVTKQNSEGPETKTIPYDNWDSSNTTKIVLTEPGTLSDYIPDSKKYSITDLTLVGPLNGADLRLLKDMAGIDYNRMTTDGKLEVIDLKDAFFVEGGPWYLTAWSDNYYYTENSPLLPDYLFAWSEQIKKIRFPKYATLVSRHWTLQCDNLGELTIPPGCTTIDYSCLEAGYGEMPIYSLTLPSSVTDFNAYIYRCPNLTDMYCYATIPPKFEYPSLLKHTNIANGTLYVPKGTAEAYWRAEGWRLFKDIKETLDVFHPLTIRVEPGGKVKYKEDMVYQSYPVWYSGVQTFEIEENECPQIEIIPDEGYFVSRVELVDKKNEVIKEYDNSELVMLDKITQPSVLKVSFSETSSINSTLVESHNCVQVYNLQGILIGTFRADEYMQNLQKGIYIIKKGANTERIFIK